MNAELPSFKNGEHNSESVSTIDRVITPLTGYYRNLIALAIKHHERLPASGRRNIVCLLSQQLFDWRVQRV